MVDITKAPFNLCEEDVRWVKDTILNMTLEEKVGQLFCTLALVPSREYVKSLITEYHVGGMMFRPDKTENVADLVEYMQSSAEIPLLVAANLESGGNGIIEEGTYYGKQMQIAAANDEKYAYQLGAISCREAASVGANWAFAPVVDIDNNWRNPIMNVRTYGSDKETVYKMAKKYVEGAFDNHFAVAVKHFPGDGVDERDQHLVTSSNSLPFEEWKESYGYIYRQLIEDGVQSVMVGHITLPSYEKKMNPLVKDSDILPASLSKNVLQGLLRTELGFNGLIITDAANMVGMCSAMSREELVPGCIMAGCDMFLFGKNLEEDYTYMLNAAKNGMLTEERLNEAVLRILALKASLKMHKQDCKKPKSLTADERKQHRKLADECAEKAVTLVCDTQHIIPVNPKEKHRVLLHVLGDEAGFTGGSQCTDVIVKELEEAGFCVDLYDKTHASLEDVCKPVAQMKREYDLILYFANIETASNKTVTRISWAPPFATDAPLYVKDVPTVFVSICNPYHYIDVPMIQTQINGYSPSESVIKAVVNKLVGKSEFCGKSPVDPFCGLTADR